MRSRSRATTISPSIASVASAAKRPDVGAAALRESSEHERADGGVRGDPDGLSRGQVAEFLGEGRLRVQEVASHKSMSAPAASSNAGSHSGVSMTKANFGPPVTR
jgi:hypothetical protein